MTPGKEESDRDAMTASRLDGVRYRRQPAAHSRRRRSTPGPDPPRSRCDSGSPEWRWPRPLSAGCCSATPIRLCGRGGYWPVRELMPAAIAFSIGGAVLLGYRKARWPAGALLICGLLAGLALLFAGLWWDGMLEHGALAQPAVHRKRHRDGPLPRAVADGIASALPRRTAARKALEGPARRLGRTGRDRDAAERVQLPDHRRSSTSGISGRPWSASAG